MKPDTLSFYERAVRLAAERIVETLDEALDLECYAREAALSPFHFHRVFRGMVGETPLELHRRLRMERAAWKLLQGDVSVTAAAFEAGYETHEAFTRAFRERYDCAPSELRQSRNSNDGGCAQPFRFELAAPSGIHFRPDRSGPLTIHFMLGEWTMDVEIKQMPELRVATVRHIGPYNRISEAFGRLGQAVATAGLLGPQSMMLGIYHDDPETTEESSLRSDAAIVVSPDAAIPDGLGEQRLPAGRYACATHVGPYTELGDAWARLMGRWLPESGHRFGEGVAYEVYRNTPGEVPAEELRTELYVPLA